MTPEHKAQAISEVLDIALGYILRSNNHLADTDLKKVRDAIALSAQSAQPQAGEVVAWRMRGMRVNSKWLPWAMVTAEQAERWQRDPSFKNGRLQIEPLYASPQPANPAQVTDAMVEAAAKAIATAWGVEWECCCSERRGLDCDCGDAMTDDRDLDESLSRNACRMAARAALTAAIGAGGEAVACKECDGTGFKDKNGARLTLARTPCGACAGSGYVAALSKLHPADERVMEAPWREVETNHLLKGRRRSPAYFPATGEVCEVSGPNCDDANGYTWGETTVLWQNDIFVLYGQPGFWPVLHKHEHVLFRPLSVKEGR